ncbi:MAG: cell division protein FtsL [Janthinobacterium lividum]
MRPSTTDNGEACTPPGSPRAAGPVFVAGMGHRMAAAALRARPPTPRQEFAPSRTGARPPPRPVDAPLQRLAPPRPVPAGPQPPGLARICQVAAFCGAAASGAALLYWQKSGGGAESREIARVEQAARQAQARTSLLRTEWAELNDPGRLQDLADRTLALRPIAPAQFVEPGQLHAWLQAPASVPPAPPPDGATEPGLRDPLVAPPVPVPPRPAPRPPRLVAAALPLPPPVPQRPLPVVLPASFPAPHLVRAAIPARFELPRWLTQPRPRSAAVPVMSEPPHDLAVPAAPRPAAVPADPWPAPSRTFAVVAAPTAEPPYDGRGAAWDRRAWPYAYAVPPPYGWQPPY